jgi:hypothetical protein
MESRSINSKETKCAYEWKPLQSTLHVKLEALGNTETIFKDIKVQEHVLTNF